MSDRVAIGRDELDRLVLMRMDLDRYEAQLIPDLQQEALALRHALRRLVESVEEAEQLLRLEARQSYRRALHDAQQLLRGDDATSILGRSRTPQVADHTRLSGGDVRLLPDPDPDPQAAAIA